MRYGFGVCHGELLLICSLRNFLNLFNGKIVNVQNLVVGSQECLLLFTPSCCGECFY